MISLHTNCGIFSISPTIFPDGTSQIWKIAEEIFRTENEEFIITWHFEAEREIFDIASLKKLLGKARVSLYMPYLPFGRQDKKVSNSSTFNLRVLADFINQMGFNQVSTLDAHNPEVFLEIFNNAYNQSAGFVQDLAIEAFKPDYIVYPDKGAMDRYGATHKLSKIFCEKVRDQSTGKILGVKANVVSDEPVQPNSRLLMIDDICDGGATFISIAKELMDLCDKPVIGLFVTHGIFSKGRSHLLANGIDEIYTTNSFLKNKNSGDFKV